MRATCALRPLHRLCQDAAVGGGTVRPWSDDSWLREAERIRAEYLAMLVPEGRPSRKMPEPQALRRRGERLDVERFRGGATDEQKRELLLVAVRQAIHTYDRVDCVNAEARIQGAVARELERLGAARPVAAGIEEKLRRRLETALRALDRPGTPDFDVVEQKYLSEVRALVARTGTTSALAAELQRRQSAGEIDRAMVELILEWAGKVDPPGNPVAFVEECIAVEARRANCPRRLCRPDLQAALEEAWRQITLNQQQDFKLLKDPSWSKRRDADARIEAVAAVAQDIYSHLEWLERKNSPPPDDMGGYVFVSLENARSDILSHRTTQRTHEGPYVYGPGDDPVEVEPAQPTAPDLELAMAELRAALNMVLEGLCEAGVLLAAVFEDRRHGTHHRQVPVFVRTLDIAALTVALLRRDLTRMRDNDWIDLAASTDKEVLLGLLNGLAGIEDGKDPGGWLKPWTFEAQSLIDEAWAAEYSGLPYQGTKTLAEGPWRRLHRVTAGDPDYNEQTVRSGATVGLLRIALAPAIEQFRVMRSQYHRRTKGGVT